ncbi:hypothetical protein FocnCong_v021693 [Fusarium oxysporum f. sp. conglutinans]|nr:hypothetical protein FocnCong_v021693 [Fusarium oxysporum f. sp. conglutinans]
MLEQSTIEGRNQDAEILADRAVALAVEEIARAYHQHFLAKLHSYWDRLRGKVGRQKLPVLDMLQQAQEESAAETGRIPTAQAVHGIYAEAWDKYRQATADDDSNGDINTSSSSLRSALPEELPCWMTTRRRRLPRTAGLPFSLTKSSAAPSHRPGMHYSFFSSTEDSRSFGRIHVRRWAPSTVASAARSGTTSRLHSTVTTPRKSVPVMLRGPGTTPSHPSSRSSTGLLISPRRARKK